MNNIFWKWAFESDVKTWVMASMFLGAIIALVLNKGLFGTIAYMIFAPFTFAIPVLILLVLLGVVTECLRPFIKQN